ncbi:NAD(P)/FAD-dependent oxidoreductase [Clostridium cellulovorans]|uniref:HI0933 family protein n=1 Tax=Clostridium cellulovorans (strain ATCC 35296 / DSM 3052 / OCM 3 / 743B) TaxID=573061 RepID=D9SPA6_CLOC7|nr:NAD(P)/FAD-dependent oxidoreductase [Clostridium cellulovorans]ADL54008.1 HI0933 family protein [Clostridium cellulovorans 743B]
MYHDIIIIGGGASGLCAAITAKNMGMDVAIIEGTDRIGKKILTTGNGRCNISNKHITPERYHSNNKGFPNSILNKYNLHYTLDFFSTLGLPIIESDGDKLFPMSLQASSVVDIFRLALDDLYIPVYSNILISSIKKVKNNFNLSTKSGNIYTAKKVILACGGKTLQKTGSIGIGYSLATSLGHKVTNLQPAIVQLKLSYPHLKALSGIKFEGSVDIFVDSAFKRKEFGEILFTDYGISGPPVLQISRIASFAISEKKHCKIELDLMPNFSEDQLIDFIENRLALFSYRSVYTCFIGILNKKLITTFLKDCGIDNIHSLCSDLSWKNKEKLFANLKHWSFTVSDHNSFTNAQVTAGGIDTMDVNRETLESLIVPNLFFCGEILDVDGDCGGFNLQWAWSSGFAAAFAASQN